MNCANPATAILVGGSRRDQILCGVTAYLHGRRGGSDDPGIAEIAGGLGLPESTVRAAFPDEQTLWCAVLDWYHGRLMGVLEHEAVRRHGPVEALEHVFRRHVAFLANHPAIPSAILARMRAGDTRLRDKVRDALESYRQGIAVLLGQAITGELLDGRTEPNAGAALLIEIILGLAVRATSPGGKRAPDWLRGEAERAWLLYLDALRGGENGEKP